jgi:hypothetical protein
MKKEELFKIMWVGNNQPILWDIYSENAAPGDIVFQIKNAINFSDWLDKYKKDYTDWLDDENDNIFNLDIEAYDSLLKSIQKFNIHSSGFKIYYWYDVDRSKQPNFKWTRCIRCNSDLEEIKEANYLNRYVCVKDCLVYPEVNTKA